MATVTATLGLTLPIGTEKVSRAIINGNMQLIDNFAGSTNAAITTLNSKVTTNWTSCADYKETIESGATAILSSFGNVCVLSFMGVSRAHTEDEVLMTFPASLRPTGGNNVYGIGTIGGESVSVRLNGTTGELTLFTINGAGAGRLYFQLTWIV